MTKTDSAAAHPVAHATFHLERSYPASTRRVFQAFADEAAKSRWFNGTPGEWELLERRMEFRVGGHERVRGRWRGGMVSTFDAFYYDIIEERRIVYTYQMQLDERRISVSLATIELQPEGTGTRLGITEQGAFMNGYEDNGARERGTGELLDRLGASLRA
jgi:uncharacterized protein YndB with AHSA1/START domain